MKKDKVLVEPKFRRVENFMNNVAEHGTIKPVRAKHCFGYTFITTHDKWDEPEYKPQGAVYYTKLGENHKLGELTKIDTITKYGKYTDEYLEKLGKPPMEMYSILGIACDPWGTDDDFDVYFSISRTFSLIEEDKINKVKEFDTDGYFPYVGAVVKLSSAENFEKLHWVVTNLPVSGNDHAINGLDFLHDGRLLVTVGGQTNAGWPSIKYGGMYESPLTASVLAVPVKKEGFNGIIKYKFLPEAESFTEHPGFVGG